MNCLVRDDWGSLLVLLSKDLETAEKEDRGPRRQAARREENERMAEEKAKDRKRRNALSLLSRGLISKAVRTINSYGIGDMEDQAVKNQMAAKYPERGIPLQSGLLASDQVFPGQSTRWLHGPPGQPSPSILSHSKWSSARQEQQSW